MAGLFQVDGIVLACRDFGEADKLLHLMTPDYGRIEAIAKGVRKTNSSLRGGTQLLAYSRFLLYSGRSLAVVTQCELLRSFIPLRTDLNTLAYAYYLAEIAAATTMPGQPNAAMFHLLVKGLNYISTFDPEMVARAYEARTLKLLGLQPRLRHCAFCGRAVPPQRRIPFVFEAGGVLCSVCYSPQRRAVLLTGSALAAWYHLELFSWNKLRRLRLDPGLRSELAVAMPDYLEYHLEQKLRSRDFINVIRGEQKRVYRTGEDRYLEAPVGFELP